MSQQRTTVGLIGDAFYVNGDPTYRDVSYYDHEIEGLLLNARMVQAGFDDLNPETRGRWTHEGRPWDAEANTEAFVAMLPIYKQRGLICICFNLQGGSPEGYSVNYNPDQPWINSAFDPAGNLRDDYMKRVKRVLDATNELEMVVMLGLFYFGQDGRFESESAVTRACDNIVDWLIEHDYRHVLIEVGNEIDNRKYTQDIIKSPRGTELMERVKQRSTGKVENPHGRLLVSNSYCGGRPPSDEIIDTGDFVLLHGNGVTEPDRIRAMVDEVRARPTYRKQPVVFNEDDHFDFDKPDNNFVAAISRYAGWGYFDYRMKGEGYDDGYQSVPVNWQISSDRKRGFFNLLEKMTGGLATLGEDLTP